MSTADLVPPPLRTPVRPLRGRLLVDVELRKMTDTRSARGVLAGTIGLVVLALVWRLTRQSADADAFVGADARPTVNIIGVFAPVLGLLAMTSEWTQRTALSTFTLCPRRLPVIVAKVVAAMIVSLSLLAVGLALSAAATGLGGLIGERSSFDGAAEVIRSAVLVIVLQVSMAMAVGALIANSAGALVTSFVAPIAWSAAADDVLGRSARWLDVYATTERLMSGDPWSHLGWTATSIVAFVIVPAAIGVHRTLHREVV